MTHLSPAELVDAADATLADGRAAHLGRCAACAARVSELRAVSDAARRVGIDDVPDPSPLYWQHLSARVRERVETETIVPAWRAAGWGARVRLRALMPIASALAVVAVVVASGLVPHQPPAARRDATVLASTPADAVTEADDSEVWQVLTSAAAEVPIEDAHAAGMGIGAGAVDRAVQRMSPDELTELRRLLQSELRRSGD